MNPKVTIWCLVYNHEKYLRQTLEGFVNQITNFTYEAIVHDDVSTDGSVEIIKEFAAKYPDIIKPILEKENQFSKNNGSLEKLFIKTMTGEYVAICEGDDYWIDMRKLQKQVDYLDHHKSVNIATHNAYKNYSDGRQEPFNKDLTTGVYNIRQCLNKRWFTPTSSFLFRNNFVLSLRWYENGSNGDMAILFSNLMIGNLYYSDEIMSVYNYCTPSSLSSSTPRKILYEKKIGMLKTINMLSNNRYFTSTFPLMVVFHIKKAICCIMNMTRNSKTSNE